MAPEAGKPEKLGVGPEGWLQGNCDIPGAFARGQAQCFTCGQKGLHE